MGRCATSCASHKTAVMVPHPTKRCSDCRELGTHEQAGQRYCVDHAPADSQNLGLEPCLSCGLEDILWEGRCVTCNPDTIKQQQQRKEMRIFDVMTAAGLDFVHNKTVDTACGRERPDFQLDAGTHMIYVEVDEHQHQSYACECEQSRMVNLVQASGMKTVFIRYNPDAYDGKHKSVSGTQREAKLIDWIRHVMDHPPSNFASVLYLYYDHHSDTKPGWHSLI